MCSENLRTAIAKAGVQAIKKEKLDSTLTILLNYYKGNGCVTLFWIFVLVS